MKTVTLYSQPACQPCIAVERRLKKNGTPYTKINVQESPEAAARVRELGFNGTPVVEYGATHFFGYSPDKIDALLIPEPVKELKRDAVVQDRDVVEDKG